MKALRPFQGEAHRSFLWPAGPAAALLLHGFPGTPAELRPVAQSLNREGWTVQGLLLPGFGAEIETLFDKSITDWLAAIEAALIRLQAAHQPVVLIGYSMGAALAIQVAVKRPPAGLVLIAPFRQLGSTWQQIVGALLSPVFRTVQPFKKTDFADPAVRQNISNFFGNIDLDEAATQQTLRELRVPTRVFGQLNQVGRLGYRQAANLKAPSLVIQGVTDEVVSIQQTRQLVQHLPPPVTYLELEAGHDLLNPEQKAWGRLERAVLNFAHRFTSEPEIG